MGGFTICTVVPPSVLRTSNRFSCFSGNDSCKSQMVRIYSTWLTKLSFSLSILACISTVSSPDGSRLRRLCDGWVGSPAMQRAFGVRPEL